MTPPTLVRVTESDCDAGLVGRADRCAVALAAARACGGPVVAGADWIYWVTPGGVLRCPTPPEARAAILAGDAGEPIGPCEFVLSGWRR